MNMGNTFEIPQIPQEAPQEVPEEEQKEDNIETQIESELSELKTNSEGLREDLKEIEDSGVDIEDSVDVQEKGRFFGNVRKLVYGGAVIAGGALAATVLNPDEAQRVIQTGQDFVNNHLGAIMTGVALLASWPIYETVVAEIEDYKERKKEKN